MQTIVLLFSVSVALLVIALLSKKGKQSDDFLRRKMQLGQTAIGIRSEELSKPLTERVLLPFRDKLLQTLPKLRFAANTDTKSNVRNERLLRQAGIEISAAGYQLIKIIFSIACILTFGIIGFTVCNTMQQRSLFIVIGLIISILMPGYYIKSKVKNRCREIRQSLPDVMDMLTVCVEAGLGLDGAIIKIAEKNNNLLTSEMLSTIKEIQFGRTRREAFKDLGERYDVGEVKTFTAAMIQGEKYGVPVKGILKAQAAKLREARKQAAQEKAMKSPVKIMIPIVIFIFPVIFIILMGPSVINIMETLL